MNARSLAVAALPLLVAGCRGCDPNLNNVKPVLAVSPSQIDFGRVKVGSGTAEAVVKLTSQSQTSVAISGITVEDGPIAGAAAAYSVVGAPEVVPTLKDATFNVRFAPTDLQAYEATLVISSNDPEHPKIEVALSGEGAYPVMAVKPECSATLGCKATVVEDPPSIDFGLEPIARAVPIPVTELPKVNVINESEVELVVTRIAIEGPDASAFTLEGGAQIPAEGMKLDAGGGVNLSIRFKPTSEQQTDYRAEMVIRGDDPDHPEARVALKGKLGPNLPPRVCANIVKVKPGDGSAQRTYDSAADWAPLLVPPMGGYDFTSTRDIDPRAVITFSAWSNSADDRTCTTDPEDRRQGLVYSWEMTKWPTGGQKQKLTGDTTPTASLSPVASGEYEVTLTVKDAQGVAGAPGHATSVPIKFAVVLKQDLVIQLSWNGNMGAYAGVDLDLHLVRPSSAPFSFFDEGSNQDTSGDINGLAFKYYDANKSSGIGFHWGLSGVSDDPRLNLDDLGNGALIENISLNYPEHDEACATQECRYKVYVHYFRDARNPSPAACTVGGSCKDGEPCDCANPGERCVAVTAPKGASPSGPGKCYLAPEPVVKIFFKGNPTPAAVIPLDTLNPPDELRIGAPCQMLYVADVVWPAQNSQPADGGMGPPPRVEVKGADANGRITSPVLSRYGIRSQGGLECTANEARGGSIDNWYKEEPL